MGTTKFKSFARRDGMIGSGALLVTKLTVYLSTMSTRLSVPNRLAAGDFVAGLMTRSKLNFTTAAVSSSPS